MRAAQHDRVRPAGDAAAAHNARRLARRGTRELAGLDLLDQARTRLRDDLDVARILLEQCREARAVERADRRRPPTTRLRVALTAGFTAGSIAMIGKSKRARNSAAAAAVAVLHATTTAAAPWRRRNSVSASERSRM